MPELELERRDGVAICYLDPGGGFMIERTVEALDEVTAALAEDDTVRTVILTGAQAGTFIRHYSVEELEKVSRQLRGRGYEFSAERLVKERPLDRVFSRLAEMPQPVIAAINGDAMGGGFELALACDLRIAEEGDYSLGLPEINIGLLPGAGGTQRLARLIGTGRALELVLRGRTVPPAEALALGMVQETAKAPVLDQALRLGQELAEKPAKALAHIKQLMRRAAGLALEDALAIERTLFLDLLVSDDALDRMSAMNRGERDIHGAARAR